MADNTVSCKLGFEVDYTIIATKLSNPKPKESCYRPENMEEFYKALRLNNKRKLREEAK